MTIKDTPANRAARERMQRLRAERIHPCAVCQKRRTLKTLCESCAAIKREERLKASGVRTERGKHRGKKKKDNSMSTKTRTHKQDINISSVYVSEPGLLSRQQKFPGGFCCNVPVSNRALMQRAAKELNFAIAFTAPRNRDAAEFVGVVADLNACDPKALLEHYYTLLLQRRFGIEASPEGKA